MPRENAFQVLDEAGMKRGSASVIEYISEGAAAGQAVELLCQYQRHG